MPAARFELFGFPVHVRPGFMMFMVLVVFINGAAFGIALAFLLALFTLLHELGHAFAARATGAKAEISLDFLAGYASFVPTRPLRPWERVGISFAGPAAQITAGLVAYVMFGGRGLVPENHPFQVAAWWAGPIIGLLNLIPILPFDGGTIVQVGVEQITPRHARSVMYGITVAVAGVMIVVMMSEPRLRPLVLFLAIPLVSVAQGIAHDRDRSRRVERQEIVSRAEAFAWATGDVSAFPQGYVPSPWFRAHQQLSAGAPDVARDLLLDDLRNPDPARWWPPDAAPVSALAALLALLPRPLPVDQGFPSWVLSGVMLRAGDPHEAGAYAARAYQVHRSPMLAIHVARAAAKLDDRDNAIAWLQAAARDADPVSLQLAIRQAPELQALASALAPK